MMLKHVPAYRRLHVGGIGLTGSASYWLGPDHLILVVLQGYAERYHRVAFADIQALVVRDTRVRAFWTIVLGVLLALCLSGILTMTAGQRLSGAAAETLASFIILCVLAVGFLVPLVLNWVWGPTCVCHLRTAVQTMPLPHMRRLHRAERFIAELTPLIETSQAGMGSLPEVAVSEPAPATGLESPSPAPEPAMPPVAEPPPPQTTG